jgi:hypothetical protein
VLLCWLAWLHSTQEQGSCLRSRKYLCKCIHIYIIPDAFQIAAGGMLRRLQQEQPSQVAATLLELSRNICNRSIALSNLDSGAFKICEQPYCCDRVYCGCRCNIRCCQLVPKTSARDILDSSLPTREYFTPAFSLLTKGP